VHTESDQELRAVFYVVTFEPISDLDCTPYCSLRSTEGQVERVSDPLDLEGHPREIRPDDAVVGTQDRGGLTLAPLIDELGVPVEIG
jgi:hypothetical protein